MTITLQPMQLDLFAAPAAPPSTTISHAEIALRCAGTIDRLVTIAHAGAPARPVAGGAGDGIRWGTTSRGITVASSGVCSTFTWRALDGALALVLTPGVCSALAAWSARWRSMHDTPYSTACGRAYRWPTYLYVADLARAIEHDVQASAVDRLVTS